MTTIATGRPTSWNVFFTPERGDPITTTATARCDPRLIDELHGANRRPEFSTLLEPLKHFGWLAFVLKH